MFFRLRYMYLGYEQGLTISAKDEQELTNKIKRYGIDPDNLIEWESNNGNGYIMRSISEFEHFYYMRGL